MYIFIIILFGSMFNIWCGAAEYFEWISSATNGAEIMRKRKVKFIHSVCTFAHIPLSVLYICWARKNT